MIKISIIIPIYKSELFLGKCIDSILQQSIQDFELLLIDDGSPDNSGSICDDYAKHDTRIKVIHQNNQGASSARNKGLDIAVGEWICFVDSDDYVDSEYLSNLLSGVNNHTDIVYSNYDSYNYITENKSLDLETAVEYMKENSIFNMSGPVAKLFKRELIQDNQVRFPLGIHMGEDAIFNIRSLNFANNISFVTSNDYHYNKISGSLSTRYYSFKSEYMAYKYWKKDELTLFSRFFNKDKALKMTWETRIEGQFNRVLQSVYRHRPKYSFKEQLNLLKLIEEKDIIEYKEFYHPLMFRRKFNKYLIVNRMYKLFIIIGILDKYIYKG